MESARDYTAISPASAPTSCDDAYGRNFVILDPGNGESQYLPFQLELDISLGTQQFYRFHLHAGRQRHPDALRSHRIDGLQPAMIRIRVRIVEQVHRITSRRFPGEHLQKAVALNLRSEER